MIKERGERGMGRRAVEERGGGEGVEENDCFPEGRVKNERAMKGSEEAVEERLVRVRHDPG